MKNENTPTTRYLFDEVLKDFVTFEDDKILLSESIPKELALFLCLIIFTVNVDQRPINM